MNSGSCPERLIWVVRGLGTTGSTARAPVIGGCIGWRIAALYLFTSLCWKGSCEDTGNVDLFGVPDARAWTILVGRTSGGMINKLWIRSPSEVILTEPGPACAIEVAAGDVAPGFFEWFELSNQWQSQILSWFRPHDRLHRRPSESIGKSEAVE